MADATVRGRFVWHDLQTPNPAGCARVLWQRPRLEDGGLGARPCVSHVRGAERPDRRHGRNASDSHRTGYRTSASRTSTLPSTPRRGWAGACRPRPRRCRTAASTPCSSIRKAPHSASMPRASAPAPEAAAATRRVQLARARDERRSEHRVRVLRSVVRLGRNQPNRHGPDGHVPGLRPQRQAARRHVRQRQRRQARQRLLARLRQRQRSRRHDRARQRRHAARCSRGPMDVPGGDRIAQLMDPHGAFFALHKAAAQAAAGQEGSRPRSRRRRSSTPAKPRLHARNRRPRRNAAAAGESEQAQAKKAPKRRPRRRRRPARKHCEKTAREESRTQQKETRRTQSGEEEIERRKKQRRARPPRKRRQGKDPQARTLVRLVFRLRRAACAWVDLAATSPFHSGLP